VAAVILPALACNLSNAPMAAESLPADADTATVTPNPTDETTPASTDTPEPALTPTETITPTITQTPIMMTAGQDLSCVKGPHWVLFDWVARINEDETVTLLAKASEDWEEYYYVRKSGGTECWAFGGSSTKTGDYAGLPVREAPPLTEVTYTITNQTMLPVVMIQIREKDSTDWGPNRLSVALLHGSIFSLDLTAGFYDIMVRDSAAGVLYEKYDWPIGPEANYRNIVLDDELEFSIQNNFAFDLCTFSVRPSGGSWATIHGAADGNITTGEKLTFHLLPGFYDLQIQRCGAGLVVNTGGMYFGPAHQAISFP
jgi:hypothetical protein